MSPPHVHPEGRAKKDARRVTYALAAMAVASILYFPGISTVMSFGALYVALSFVWRLHRRGIDDGNAKPTAEWKIVAAVAAFGVLAAIFIGAVGVRSVWTLIGLLAGAPVVATLALALRARSR